MLGRVTRPAEQWGNPLLGSCGLVCSSWQSACHRGLLECARQLLSQLRKGWTLDSGALCLEGVHTHVTANDL